MAGQFIDTFWRKSFIGDLRRARKISENENQWSLMYDGKTHQFQYVWLQGLCIKIDKNADLMIIEDATGQAELQKCSRAVDAWSTKEGDYLMTAGKLLNTNSSDRIIVDTYKIQCFKTLSKQEINWPFEVVDISQRVYHYY
ncbi:unnamed protein product [Adineta steineri]|uniref:Uncharacterized protein n=1 Tax=Adineta steineri TaxID=433720 RepID=A0A818UGF7_9BILA|nr:unnamed protein product [Adineta steineri]CAF1161998.1 unnamed protein product [Adineta steineri]CAF1184124.1 unnamed protein product [Adineta steineri]CAF3692849.1 unnamed protein product [Adineta steineri]CAF3811835.1 unnamed protein product [Adineta steineri]